MPLRETVAYLSPPLESVVLIYLTQEGQPAYNADAELYQLTEMFI